MFDTISHKAIFLWIIFLSTIFLWIDHKSIYLSMKLGTSHLLRFRVGHLDTFREVLGVLSECMVKREELSMLVER